MDGRDDLLVVCGPTATGKTETAIRLASQLHGEVISADSMQLYRGLCIGTAQPGPGELREIPHHLLGILSPEESFSVADYVQRAAACIADITARGRVPIVVGGTGLYISSLVNGIDFTDVKTDPALRARLQQELSVCGSTPLLERLQKVDPVYAAKLYPADHNRILRALEWYEQTGETMTSRLARSRPAQKPYRTLIAGLHFPQRATLYARIDARVDEMLGKGLLAEARMVYDHRGSYRTAAQAIGYKEFFPYFEGKASLAACAAALRQATRRYAKRQLTWFRHMEGLVWFDASDPALTEKILRLWYKNAQGQSVPEGEPWKKDE